MDSGNALAGRDAFVDRSADWPAMSDLELPFGTQFAGQDLRIRFRVGTDAAAGAHGWEIDDIEVEGINSQPFSSIVQSGAACAIPTEPPAPPDEAADGGCAVTGSASGSGGGAFAMAALFMGWRGRRQLR